MNCLNEGEMKDDIQLRGMVSVKLWGYGDNQFLYVVVEATNCPERNMRL